MALVRQARRWLPIRTAISLVAIILSAAISSAASAGTVVPGTTTVALPNAGGNFTGTEGHVRIVSIARDTGNQDRVTVTLVIDPGYHINANPPSDKNLIPTTLTFDGFESVRILYPKPCRFKPKFSDEVLDVYQGIETIVALFPSGSLSSGTHLRGRLLAQACTDEICLPPAEIAFSD